MTTANHQHLSVYRRCFGDSTLFTLSDGCMDVPDAVWTDIDASTLDEIKQSAHLPPTTFTRNGISAFLLDTPDGRALIDAGAGPLIETTAGQFAEGLASIDIRREDIDLILLTHAHPDHFGGLMHDGAPNFPNARICLHAREIDYWWSDDARAASPDITRPWFDLARRFLTDHDGQIDTFPGTADLGRGITALPLPGHTPGHTGYLLERAGERLLAWGDLCVSPAIQFAQPETCLALDVDHTQSASIRVRMLDEAARDGTLIAATHAPFPSLGYVEKRGPSFAWLNDPWQYVFDEDEP